MKQTVKFSDKQYAAKEATKEDQQVQDALTALQLRNGRSNRGQSQGTGYEIVGNPKIQTRNLNQRFASVMQGSISFDEETGEVIDLNIKSVQDLMIAGGLPANLHNGFWLLVHQQPQPDGVWRTSPTSADAVRSPRHANRDPATERVFIAHKGNSSAAGRGNRRMTSKPTETAH